MTEGARPPAGDDIPRVDGFVDLVEVGRGGFSVVYSATQVAFDRRVALKVLNLSGDEARRSEREARALGRLSDLPNVVQAYAVLTAHDGRPVLVMALLPTSLGRIVRERGGVDVAEALRWLDQTAEALDGAHRLGVWHRDIKPENILVSSHGNANLADFGIAGVDDTLSSTTTALSFSPPHSPPERLMGEEIDPRSGDLYSLASTFYTVMTGTPPFGTTADGGVYGLTKRVVGDPLPARRPIPPAAHAVFEKAMAKSPADRYATAAAFAADLRAALAAPGVGPGVVTPGPAPWPQAPGTPPAGTTPATPVGRVVVGPPPPPAVAPAESLTHRRSVVDPPSPVAAPTPPPFAGPPGAPGAGAGAPPPPPAPPGAPPVPPSAPAPAGTGGDTAPPVPRGDSKRPRDRRGLLLVATGLLVFAVAAVAVWLVIQRPDPPEPEGRLAAGGVHTCALDEGGQPWCWGSDAAGQLGDGSIGGSAVRPTKVLELAGVAEVVAGNQHSCVLDAGRLLCWGRNDWGELGDGTTDISPEPSAVEGLGTVESVAAGRNHTCALVEDGTVWCWGNNAMGQLGLGTDDTGAALARTSSSRPVQVPGLERVEQITAGNAHTCALTDEGQVACWGDDNLGQVGTPAAGGGIVALPTVVADLPAAEAVAAGPGHTCAIAGSGVWCWGNNTNGELGGGTDSLRSETPVKVSGLGRPRHLTAGGGITGTAPDLGADGHTCALVDDEVWCWGDNRHGQLGDGTTEDRAEPVRVQGLDDAKWVEAGGGPRRLPDDSSESRAHTCALRADDRFVCWGDNDQGQLGDGSENRATRPVEVELPRE